MSSEWTGTILYVSEMLTFAPPFPIWAALFATSSTLIYVSDDAGLSHNIHFGLGEIKDL